MLLAVGVGCSGAESDGSPTPDPVSPTDLPLVTPSPKPVDPALPPESPCDTTSIVAHFAGQQGTCSSGTELGAQVESLGFQLERVHDCETLASLSQVLEITADQELLTSLSSTYFLATTEGRDITREDLLGLLDQGFYDLEFDCPIASMGAPNPEKPRRAGASAKTGNGYIPHTGWNALVTGLAGESGVLAALGTGAAGSKVRVAVVDSGIDPSIPPPASLRVDLGWSYEQDLGTPASTLPWLKDEAGHGSAVSSLIGEFSNGAAELVSVKVLDNHGRGTQARLARGLIKSVVELNAKVVNLSLAYPAREATSYGNLKRYLLEPLATISLMGAQIVAAAGNTCEIPGETCERFFPAAIDSASGASTYALNVTSVWGVNAGGTRSSQSASCESDVGAPSEFVCGYLGQVPRFNKWQRLSGTSFAAAEFSGSLALAAGYLNKSSAADLATIRDVMVRNADSGRLDLCQSFSALGVPVPGCSAWKNLVDPAGVECQVLLEPGLIDHAYSTLDTNIGSSGYPTSDGYDTSQPTGQGCDGIWCRGLSSAPSTPICTSCEYCFSSSGGTFQLMLQMAPESNSFTDFQLRVTGPLGNYLYFNLPELVNQGGNVINYVGNLGFNPPPPANLEAYLMATDGNGLWTGVPLLKVSCP